MERKLENPRRDEKFGGKKHLRCDTKFFKNIAFVRRSFVIFSVEQKN